MTSQTCREDSCLCQARKHLWHDADKHPPGQMLLQNSMRFLLQGHQGASASLSALVQSAVCKLHMAGDQAPQCQEHTGPLPFLRCMLTVRVPSGTGVTTSHAHSIAHY